MPEGGNARSRQPEDPMEGKLKCSTVTGSYLPRLPPESESTASRYPLSGVTVTDEHILPIALAPIALAGNVYLSSATCEECHRACDSRRVLSQVL